MLKRIMLVLFLIMFNNICAQDNVELKKMYEEDQKAREEEKINWKELTKQDSIRRCLVKDMIKQNMLSTSNDYYHAAMVFQHGKDSTSYKLAWDYSLKASMMDTANTNARWLSAASYDRYLISKGKPQVYGTQFIILDKKYYLQDIDTTKVTDIERKYYGTRTIEEIKEYLTKQNGENKGLLIFPKSKKIIVK